MFVCVCVCEIGRSQRERDVLAAVSLSLCIMDKGHSNAPESVFVCVILMV